MPYLNIQHEKCNQMSTNKPGIGSVVFDLAGGGATGGMGGICPQNIFSPNFPPDNDKLC